ncbi:MAG TPA: enoyl-CoA hydratase/isomerase family protein, partial [Solirubrobacterales bacterium]|nr:enoyl-CoA hydratase/isomerase family protein [Solirubrobacterales bacterium]
MSLTTYGVDDRGVALIQLDRPKAMNAINTEMLVELIEHIAVARGDEGVKVLVFSSTDYMAFSAGADIKEDIDDEAKVNKMQLFADLYDAVVQFPKPTIAA